MLQKEVVEKLFKMITQLLGKKRCHHNQRIKKAAQNSN